MNTQQKNEFKAVVRRVRRTIAGSRELKTFLAQITFIVCNAGDDEIDIGLRSLGDCAKDLLADEPK